MMKKITRYFLEGLLFLVPVVVTIYTVWFVFESIDKIFSFPIPGMGFLFTLLFITTIGFMASNFLTSRLVGFIDRFFSRLPLLKMIYTAVKDLIEAFVGDKKRFNKPVAVQIVPNSDILVLGFITREDLDTLGLVEHVAVYLPQSYNFAGNLIIVPENRVRPINAESGEVMTFIVSGGVAYK